MASHYLYLHVHTHLSYLIPLHIEMVMLHPIYTLILVCFVLFKLLHFFYLHCWEMLIRISLLFSVPVTNKIVFDLQH